jgi:glycosyltransferase involved in cell wall biosynthesis
MIISCIIPTFNRAHFLPGAIRTVHEQKLSSVDEIEIIVVDDGSTDNTAGVVAALGDDIRYIRLKQNRGVSAARNAGVHAARGECLAFLDSDDLWMPDKLRKQIRLMQANEGCELVCGQLQVEHLQPGDH